MPNERAHSRRTVILAAGLVVAVLAAAGAIALWFNDDDGAVLEPGRGYTEAVTGTWQRVNPLFAAANPVDADLATLVFSSLVRIAPDGTVVPDLAELPAVTDGGETYTFTIRDGARWHDGQPVTARDVAFTIERVKSPDFDDPALAEGWIGTEVETPDERTVVVRLRQPSAPFLARSATVGILPEHILGSMSTSEMENAPFNARPVGSGPFVVESMDSREARLVANADYYFGPPALARITLRPYPTAAAAVQAYLDGEADGVLAAGDPSGTLRAQLEAVDGGTADIRQGARQALLYLNTSSALFRDERVRRALSLAIDRAAIVDEVYGGLATASSSPVAPGTWAYDPTVDVTEPGIEQARELLKQAGWTEQPQTGILTREGGEFRFTIRVDDDPVRVALAQAVAAGIEPLGIRATVVSTSFAVLRRDFLQERRYDAAIADWDTGPDPDPYFGWHSSQLGSAGLNFANFEDTVIDDLIARARTTDSHDVRMDTYRQLQEIWQSLVPGVVIAYPGHVYAQRESIQGVSSGVLFTDAGRFFDIHRWSR